jgi:DoxX-like family
MMSATAALVPVLMVTATVAGVFTGRREGDASSQGGRELARSIAYWLFTVVVAFELAAGALWDLLRIEFVRVVLLHLGYPLYLLIILGVWRIPGALVLLVPRFPRVKEWAYAGAFFDYTGAAASHFLVGDRAAQWAAPLIFAAFTLVSWALRPASRRLPKLTPAAEVRAGVWAVPILILAAMMVVAFFTLPKGAPPP